MYLWVPQTILWFAILFCRQKPSFFPYHVVGIPCYPHDIPMLSNPMGIQCTLRMRSTKSELWELFRDAFDKLQPHSGEPVITLRSRASEASWISWIFLDMWWISKRLIILNCWILEVLYSLYSWANLIPSHVTSICKHSWGYVGLARTCIYSDRACETWDKLRTWSLTNEKKMDSWVKQELLKCLKYHNPKNIP